MKRASMVVVGVIFAATAVVHGCSSSEGTGTSDAGVDARGGESTGQSCAAPSECYPAIDGAALAGEAVCLDRVSGGYCTHLCKVDTDCCAVPGECKTGIAQVCSPFESTGQNMCFLSCEAADLRPAPDGGAVLDEATYCTTYAGRDFKCRSSGGGNKNRKVCVPGGTSATDASTDGG